MWARENARAVGPSCNGIVRRIVNLPVSIIGGVSRAVGHGMTLMGVGRRDQTVHLQPPQQQSPIIVQEEFAFLTSFQQRYGLSHPFFYACRFAEALKMAEDESRFLFVYLHSPEHPYTAAFCCETLCSELVVQFLDANFISWGAFANRGEGLQLAAVLKAASFPFCAVVVPASGSNMAVLQQVEGPVSPAQLMEILQRTVEEQGSAFRAAKAAEDEVRRANRLLREEQDAAYHAALQMDKQKGRIREVVIEEPQKESYEKQKKNHLPTKQSGGKVKDTAMETPKKQIATQGKDAGVTQIQIRFPKGDRKEQSFLCTDKIQSIYRYIDSLDLPGIGSYQLISNFPRKIYGFEKMGMTLKEAGLHPSASLFLELVE